MNPLGSWCLGLAFFLLAAAASSGDEILHWSLSTPAPEPRSDYAAAVLDGKLIIVGGTWWTGTKDHWIKKQFSSSVHSFDPRSGTWTKLPDLPIPLGCATAAVVGNRLFVLGGYTGSQVNRKIYTLESQHRQYSWKEFGEFPFDRVYPRAVSVGKMLFVVGGTEQFEPRDPTGTCCSSKTAKRSLTALDTEHPQTGWKDLPGYPGDLRFYFGAETDGRAIWMFGGIYQDSPRDPIVAFHDVARYDIAAGKWEQAKPLPDVSHEGNSPSAVFVGDGFVLVTDSQKVWKLDRAGETYRELTPLPELAALDRFVWVNDEIIGATGENFIQGPRRRSEWVFVGKFEAK
jgi:N-acetylneuraminic acid mutarotase